MQLRGLRGRKERAMEMSDGLAKVGIKGAYEGALQFVGNPELISRTHFARFLVESELASGALVVLSDQALTPVDAYYLVYPESRAQAPLVQAFRDWVLAQAAQHPGGSKSMSS